MDFKNITKLAEIMTKFGLTKLEVTEKDSSICLAKEATAAIANIPAVAMSNVNDTAECEECSVAEEEIFIKSPMPGTFYRSTSPDAAPFIQMGDTVHPNTVVCIIEAMKVMNEIKSETEGRIVRCLVEDGSPVEFGQPLFAICK